MPVVDGFKHALVSDGTGLNVDNSTPRGCPLWVISRHVQRTSRCPLSAKSGPFFANPIRVRSVLEFTVSAQARDAWDQISTVGSKIAWQLRRPEHRAPCYCNGDAPTQSVSCQFQYPDQAVLAQRPNL